MKGHIAILGALLFLALLDPLRATPGSLNLPKYDVSGASKHCGELIKQLDPELLKSPTGIIVKIVCPSRIPFTNPFSSPKAIEGLDNDQFLSLFTNEINQYGYWVQALYRKVLASSRVTRIMNQRYMPKEYEARLYTLNTPQNGFPVDIAVLHGFKVLELGNLPTPAFSPSPFPFELIVDSRTPIEYCILPQSQRTVDLSQYPVDIYKSSAPKLLGISPLAFLLREKRFVEAQALAQEFHRRTNSPTFREAFRKLSKDFADGYHVYYSSTYLIRSQDEINAWVPTLQQFLRVFANKYLSVLVASVLLFNGQPSDIETYMENIISRDELDVVYDSSRGMSKEERRFLRDIIDIKISKEIWDYDKRNEAPEWVRHGLVYRVTPSSLLDINPHSTSIMTPRANPS